MTIGDYEVLLVAPQFASPPTLRGARATDAADLGPAARQLYYRGRRVQHVLYFDYLLQSRAEIDELRDFFHDRAGKWQPFFVPSWHQELVLAADGVDTESTIDVSPVGYAAVYGPNADDLTQLGNYVWLLDIDGSFHVSRVLSVEAVDGIERLTLETALDRDWLTGDCIVGFLYFVRFLQDELTLEFTGPEQAMAKLAMQETFDPIVEIDAPRSTFDDEATYLTATYWMSPAIEGPPIVQVAWVDGVASFLFPDDTAWDLMDDTDYVAGTDPTIDGGIGWGSNGTIEDV